MKILITSALPYINNVPHLGNLIGAVLSADVFARFQKSRGQEVLYICGADEHGTTTETKALEEGVSPQELCDKYFELHKKIYEWFNIGFDHFGRTHHPTHTNQTQHIFKKLHENGYVNEGKLEQTYCEHDKRFLADRFVEGTCPFCSYEDARGDQCDQCGRMLNPKELQQPRCKLCGNEPIIKEVTHLFLDLPRLQPDLMAWVEEQSQKGGWSENAKRITKGWFKEGLEPRCITRDLSWGVSVPLKGWEDKVFYVWFDAPIGYISITEQHLGAAYEEWWKRPKEVKLYQFMGKDNIPFHTLLFPASLIGTKESWTMAHHLSTTEYLQYEDGKFSKSRGVGVFGDDAISSGIPSDVYRYYLLTNRPETADTLFSWKDFGAKLNNELVANLGNLINRTLVFLDRFYAGTIPKAPALDEDDQSFWNEVREQEQVVTKHLEAVEIKDGLHAIMDVARLGNAYYQRSAPWKMIKEHPKKAAASLYLLTHLCRDLAVLIEPYLPATTHSIFRQLNLASATWQDLGTTTLDGLVIGKPKLLFSKVDDKKLAELRKRFAKKEKPSLDLRVGKITKVVSHPKADKLYIEEVDLGPLGKRTIVSGLAPYYTPEELLGLHIVIVANLEPAKLRGVISQGMLLACEQSDSEIGVVIAPTAVPGTLVSSHQEVKQQVSPITIKNFLEFDLKATPTGVLCNQEPLLADGKPLRVHRDFLGKVG